MALSGTGKNWNKQSLWIADYLSTKNMKAIWASDFKRTLDGITNLVT